MIKYHTNTKQLIAGYIYQCSLFKFSWYVVKFGNSYEQNSLLF